jgi:dTDP-4-dehydrorhamnose reductase
MAILLFGATGMLGQAIAAEATRRGDALCRVSRHGPDRTIDLASIDGIKPLLAEVAPALVINAAAIADIEACERDPVSALAVNARAVLAMAEFCRDATIPFVQISTDHFFTGNGAAPHSELAPVALVNHYARTKFLAEGFASLAPQALIVRTNITGLRRSPGRPSFAEWALDALERRAPLRLFDDFYTSTIDTPSFARALFDLMKKGATGVVNLASRTIASKRHFVHTLASAMGIALDWDGPASVATFAVARAESLGLDVAKAERLLGYALPDIEQVCGTLVAQWEHERCAIPLAS